MTYAIAHIIYGIDLSPETVRTDARLVQHGPVIDRLRSEDALGTAYSGSGDRPVWLGATMGHFDECNTIDGKALVARLTPNAQHEAEYREAVHQLTLREDVPQAFRELIRSYEPRVFVTWGSS